MTARGFRNYSGLTSSPGPVSRMLEFLRSTTAQAVLWAAALIVVSALGVYLVRRFREHGDTAAPSASELLSDFRRMREGGSLTNEEFRQIKGALGPKLQPPSQAVDGGQDQ